MEERYCCGVMPTHIWALCLDNMHPSWWYLINDIDYSFPVYVPYRSTIQLFRLQLFRNMKFAYITMNLVFGFVTVLVIWDMGGGLGSTNVVLHIFIIYLITYAWRMLEVLSSVWWTVLLGLNWIRANSFSCFWFILLLSVTFKLINCAHLMFY